MQVTLPEIRHGISILTVPVYFLVVWSLYRRGICRSYRYLCVSLLLEGATMAALYLPGGSPEFRRIVYLLLQPPAWIIYVLMVIEVFQRVFAGFPGLARSARRAVVLLMILAFLFAISSIGDDITVGWHGTSLISRYSVLYRTVTSAISVFLILITALLVWMPVPLPPNAIRHSVIFFAYFLIITGVHYVMNSSVDRAQYLQAANLVIAIATLVALVCWHLLLTPSGEFAPAATPAHRASSRELLARLEAMQSALSPPGRQEPEAR